MEIKEVFTKTFKQTLEILIIVSIVSFHLQHLFESSAAVNLYTAVMILISMSGLFTVFNYLNNPKNNRANVIAIGYAAISVLLIIKFYYKEMSGFAATRPYIAETAQYIIDLLEVIYILIGIKYVNEATKIKKVVGLNIGLLVGSLLINYRVNPIELTAGVFLDSFITISLLRIVLLFITINALFICYNSYVVSYTVNIYRLPFIIILQCVYQVIYLILYLQNNLAMDLILCIIKIMIYINVGMFIYDHTLYGIWVSTDKDLRGKAGKLADGIQQRHTLTIVSQKLQEYVEHIDRATKLINTNFKVGEESKKPKYIAIITQNCYRLKKLTDNIMAINQIEAGELEPKFTLVDIVELIQQVIESIESYASSMHINVQLIQSKQKIYCCIDTELIERVMLNLISNAIKYNKENGSVTIYVNVRKDNVYLCIKDTGYGISEDKLNKIFNRFERGDALTARKKEGSGLGLQIVKSLVEVHQGTIYIISKENKGTAVSIQFPRFKGINGKLYRYSLLDKEELEKKIKIEFSDL